MVYTLAFWEYDCQTIRAWHFSPLIKSHNSKTFRTCWILAHTLPLLDVSPCVKWLVNRNYLHPQYSYNMLQWYQALKWIKMVLWSTFAGYVENSLALWRKDEKDQMAQWYPQLIQNSQNSVHCGWTSWVPGSAMGVPWCLWLRLMEKSRWWSFCIDPLCFGEPSCNKAQEQRDQKSLDQVDGALLGDAMLLGQDPTGRLTCRVSS